MGGRNARHAVNEVFGQTECNLVLGLERQDHAGQVRPLGRAAPGHVAAIVDDDGQPLLTGGMAISPSAAPIP